MDRILERYLNRIGFDKDRSEFEGGYFANIVTTKGSNSFKATLVLRKLLSFETYREFFSSIDFFEKDLSNSFKSDLSFNYLDTIHEEDIRKLIDAFLDFNDFYEVTRSKKMKDKYISTTPLLLISLALKKRLQNFKPL